MYQYQRLSHEMHEKMNQTLRKLIYGGSHILILIILLNKAAAYTNIIQGSEPQLHYNYITS